MGCWLTFLCQLCGVSDEPKYRTAMKHFVEDLLVVAGDPEWPAAMHALRLLTRALRTYLPVRVLIWGL